MLPSQPSAHGDSPGPKGLVTLINPNFVKPGVAPYALDILSSHLELDGFDVEVVDLTWSPDTWRTVLAEYFARRRPLLIGVTLRNAASVQPQEQRVFLPEHRAVIEEIRRQTTAPIVLGGAGFSTMPYAAMEYFNVPFGVKGPGELILCALANALAAGAPPRASGGCSCTTAKRSAPRPGSGLRWRGRRWAATSRPATSDARASLTAWTTASITSAAGWATCSPSPAAP